MQISMFDGEKPYKINKPIRLIELFAGIGSQAKALQNIGADFEHYRICEFDKYAVLSYNAIHGTKFETSDITKITATDLGITDTNNYDYIMTYSFPCQDLSLAGKRGGMEKGSGTRSGLLWEVERLLDKCEELPQLLLMENVPEVLNCDFGGWLKFLEKLGYHNYYELLNAKDYGIPQNRNRTFMVSLLGDYYYTFPEPQPLKLRLKDFLESEVDEKYYLSEKAIKSLNSHKERNSEKGNSFGWSPKNKNEIASTIKTEAGYRPGSNFISEPQLLQVAQLGGYESSGRIYSDGTLITDGYTYSECCESIDLDKPFEVISVKLKTREIGAILQNGIVWYVRKLTPKECWRLMSFDDRDIEKAKSAGVSNSQLYKQAGNSIVVKVLEAIFKKLAERQRR